jgi:phosphatidylglycerophosphate synthase
MNLADLLMKVVGAPRKHNQSFLADRAQKLVNALVARLPEGVTPAQLTYLGIAGAGLTAIALIGCRQTLAWAPAIPIGVFINWLGVSLDGPLARSRNEERPSFGLLDHSADLGSQLLIIFAFGLSPFFSLVSASIVLACYLLFSSYTYIRAAARLPGQMAYIGIGTTEFRILLALWPLVAITLGIDERGVNGLTRLDEVMIILAALAVGGLMVKILLDARRIAEAKDKPDS